MSTTPTTKPSLAQRLALWLRGHFETSRATAGVNLRSMEGMRGFAVALVFLAHYCTLGLPWLTGHAGLEGVAHVLHAIGNTGVDVFFVLSGYVIYKSLVVRPQAFGGFMARRVKRIYPAFLVVLAIYIGLSLLFPAESSIPRQGWASYLLANLLLLPGLFPIKPIFTVAWSLSYEMFFYLAVPALVVVMRRCGFGAAGRTAVIAALALALAGWCAAYGGHLRMVMFMAGMLVHEAIGSRGVRVPPTALVALAFGAALLSNALPDLGTARTGLLFVGVFLLCLDCFQRPGSFLTRSFCWTPLRWLGNMSYSYYLLHGLCLKVLFAAAAHAGPLKAHGALAFVGLLLPFFALSLLGSVWLFLFVERPFSLETGHATRATPASAAVAPADPA